MKILAVFLIIAGLLSMIVPAIVQARPERGHERAATEARRNTGDVTLSLLPLMGVTALAIGGAILVAGAITAKK